MRWLAVVVTALILAACSNEEYVAKRCAGASDMEACKAAEYAIIAQREREFRVHTRGSSPGF